MKGWRFVTLFGVWLVFSGQIAQAVTPCKGYTAQLEGSNTMGAMGISQTWSQRLLMRKRDGGGIPGKWTGIEYEQTMVSSKPISPEAAAAIAATPVTMIPGVNAECHITMPNNRTVRTRCTGAYPFVVSKNGSVFWEGQTTLIGAINNPTESPPIGITMDLLAGAPGYHAQTVIDGTMTGTIYGPGGFGFVPTLSAKQYSSQDAGWSEIQVDISTKPEHDDAAISLNAKVSFTGKDQAPIWAVNNERNHVRLNARLLGGAKARRELAAKTTISATAVVDDCLVSGSWNLLELALKYGVVP